MKADKKTSKLSSNPIGKAKSSLDGIKMISVPKDSPVQLYENPIETIKPTSIDNNPSFDDIVEKINSLSSNKKPRLHTVSTYNITSTNVINSNINYFEIIRELSNAFSNNKNMGDLFSKLNDVFVNKLNWNFVGFGLLPR